MSLGSVDRASRVLRALALGAVCLATVACGASPATVPPITSPNIQPVLTNADWPSVHAQASDAVGREVELRARVYRAPVPAALGDAGEVFFGWVDFDNDQLSTAFQIPEAPEALVPDAFVWINGVVAGQIDEADPRDNTPTQPLVRVARLLVTDRIGVRPAQRVLQVNQALEQLDVRVVLQRVEFAAEETRLFFAIQNRREEMVSAFGTGLRISQRGAEFSAVFPLGAGVPPPRGRVAPGATERGGFQFPPLADTGLLEIHWAGARVEEAAEQFRDWVWIVDPSGAIRPEG